MKTLLLGSMNQAKFDALEQYNTSPLFSVAERDALDYVTELTKNYSLALLRKSQKYDKQNEKDCERITIHDNLRNSNITPSTFSLPLLYVSSGPFDFSPPPQVDGI
jgi:hypothetical protein